MYTHLNDHSSGSNENTPRRTTNNRKSTVSTTAANVWKDVKQRFRKPPPDIASVPIGSPCLGSQRVDSSRYDPPKYPGEGHLQNRTTTALTPEMAMELLKTDAANILEGPHRFHRSATVPCRKVGSNASETPSGSVRDRRTIRAARSALEAYRIKLEEDETSSPVPDLLELFDDFTPPGSRSLSRDRTAEGQCTVSSNQQLINLQEQNMSQAASVFSAVPSVSNFIAPEQLSPTLGSSKAAALPLASTLSAFPGPQTLWTTVSNVPSASSSSPASALPGDAAQFSNVNPYLAMLGTGIEQNQQPHAFGGSTSLTMSTPQECGSANLGGVPRAGSPGISAIPKHESVSLEGVAGGGFSVDPLGNRFRVSAVARNGNSSGSVLSLLPPFLSTAINDSNSIGSGLGQEKKTAQGESSNTTGTSVHQFPIISSTGNTFNLSCAHSGIDGEPGTISSRYASGPGIEKFSAGSAEFATNPPVLPWSTKTTTATPIQLSPLAVGPAAHGASSSTGADASGTRGSTPLDTNLLDL